MKRYKTILFAFIASVVFAGCDSYCTIVSYGNETTQKTYYLVPIDSNMFANPFLYKEYVQTLETNLRTQGYVKTDSASADLRIEWVYFIDAPRFVGTSEQSITNTYGWSNNNTASNTTASAQAQGTARTYDNNTNVNASAYGTAISNTTSNTNSNVVSFSNTSSSAEYERVFGCVIMSYDNRTQEPIWRVEGSASSSQEEKIGALVKEVIIKACYDIGKKGSNTYWINAQ